VLTLDVDYRYVVYQQPVFSVDRGLIIHYLGLEKLDGPGEVDIEKKISTIFLVGVILLIGGDR
jgi:hypothetical protein